MFGTSPGFQQLLRWQDRTPWQLLLCTDDIEANVIDMSEFVDLDGAMDEFHLPCGSQLQLLVLDPHGAARPDFFYFFLAAGPVRKAPERSWHAFGPSLSAFRCSPSTPEMLFGLRLQGPLLMHPNVALGSAFTARGLSGGPFRARLGAHWAGPSGPPWGGPFGADNLLFPLWS